jgi:hypothetical protein
MFITKTKLVDITKETKEQFCEIFNDMRFGTFSQKILVSEKKKRANARGSLQKFAVYTQNYNYFRRNI